MSNQLPSVILFPIHKRVIVNYKQSVVIEAIYTIPRYFIQYLSNFCNVWNGHILIVLFPLFVYIVYRS